MLGRIRWTEHNKICLRQEELLGMKWLTLDLPVWQVGFEKRLGKGCRLLAKRRVTRVLSPPDFPGWSILMRHGLRPVDTLPFRCALIPAWVKVSLQAAGIKPEQAIVALAGARESPDMVHAARILCPIVRNLVIDVHESTGLAACLRREFGLPVLPKQSVEANLILRFDSGPILDGVRFALKDVLLPVDCELLPLLSALWESGKVKTEEILLSV